MNLSYWSHGGEGVSWRKWAPFHPSATLRRVQFKSRNRLWGRNTGGKVGEMNFFALCLANCCPSRRFWVARSTPMDRGWLFLFTRGCPRRESGNVRRKGIQVRSSLCCISDSFLVSQVLSRVSFRHPHNLSCTKSGRGPLPRLGQSDPGKCWIPTLEVRAHGQHKTAGLSLFTLNSNILLYAWRLP